MTIANMSPEELRALTPEQMARLIITDNFDTGQLARGLYLNLTKDIQDCLRAVAAAQRDRDMLIAHDRATQWDAIKAAHPDDAATPAIANARYLEARYLEACDIAALIRAQP